MKHRVFIEIRFFFITPPSGEADNLKREIRKVVAYEEIKKDTSLNLTPTQKREIEEARKQSETALNNALRRDYRNVLMPVKDGLSEEDLGMPAQGVDTSLDEVVYEMLRVKGKILTSIGPRNIAIRYLKEEDTLSTSQLLHSSLRTPGETIVLRDAWEKGICQGVEEGLFGLGEKENGMLMPFYFKNMPLEIALDNNGVIIRPNLIRENIMPEEILHEYLKENDTIPTTVPFQYDSQSTNEPRPLLDMWKSAIREGVKKGTFGIGNKVDGKITPHAFMQEPSTITLGENEVIIKASLCSEDIIVEPPPEPKPPEPKPPEPEPPPIQRRKTIDIRFRLPQGKVSNVAQHLNELQSIFQNMQLELKASEGEISEDAYAEFKDNLRELGVEFEEL